MKAYFLQRMSAYIIDLLIITLVSYVVLLFVPVSNKYNKAYDEYNEALNSYVDKKIDEEEFLDIYSKTNYTMSKEGAAFTIINMLITVAYFGTYCYYKNGMTIGKKLMKIKIVSNNGKQVNHFTLILRSMLINGVITSTLSLIVLFIIKPNMYISTIGVIEIVQSLFVIITLFMTMIRKDGRGLHDLICKTKVVLSK